MPSTTLQHAPLPATTTSTPDRNLTLRVLPAVAFTFVTYLCIGISLATLPTFVHRDLGLSAILAGLFISLQYIATFASRSYAGRMADTLGPRHTVRRALLFTALSGLFLALAGLFQHSLWIAIAALTLSRLTLGVGESLGAVGAIMWGIGRVGAPNTARVIAWNGVATFTPIALGAPLGILLVARGGIAALGLFVIAVCLAAYVVATRMASTATPEGERIPLRHILPRVTPYGLALALGGMGFGVIATFITLYFAHRNWQGAALSLTIYGLAFVLARLLFASFIDRFGGFPIAAISLAVETLGLILLALDHSRQLAYIGCGLTGLGFSLVFPALGVEVANTFPPASRGSVLALYSAFVDLALFLTGPIAGLVISLRGYPATFLGIAATVLAALLLTLWLSSTARTDYVAPL